MDVSLVFAGGSKALQQFVDKGLVDLVSQQVILFDRLGIDAEGREQQEGADPGPVLTGGAVKEDRPVARGRQ